MYIESLSGRLIFRFMDNDSRLLGEQIYIENEAYEIEDGWIKFESFSKWISEEGVAILASGMQQLTIDNSGDLIMKIEGTAATLIFMVPGVIMVNSWLKFDRINGNNNAPSEISKEAKIP